jgi:hypothetical protein
MIAALEEQGIDTSTIKKTALSTERTLLVETPNGSFDTGLNFGDFRQAAQASTRASETAAEKPTAPKPAAAATPVRQAKPAAASSAEPKENAAAHSLEIVHTEELARNQSSRAARGESFEDSLRYTLFQAGHNFDPEAVAALRERIDEQFSHVEAVAVNKGKLEVRGTPVLPPSNDLAAAVSPTTSTRSR